LGKAMRPKLIALGICLLLLGAGIEGVTAVKLGQLSERRDGNDNEILGILNAHRPRFEITRDENGQVRYTEKKGRKFSSGRSTVTVTESFSTSDMSQRFHDVEARNEQIQSEMFFWQPMVRLGLVPIGVGLVLVGGAVFSYWKSKAEGGRREAADVQL
jgi:hypothetical protein